MDFENQTEADAYQNHPDHQAFVNACVKPLVKRFVVYDFGAA